MKKLLVLALVFTTLLTACSQAKKDVLTVLVSADYPPYESIDTNGDFIGFDIEFGEAIAAKMGVEFKWTDTAFDGIIGALQANAGDLAISSMSVTAERALSVDFSNVYKQETSAGETFTVVSLTSNAWTQLSDLTGKIGSTQLGTVQEQALNMLQDELTLTLDIRNKWDIIVQEIINKRIDFLLVDKATADEFLIAYPELSEFTAQHDSLAAINGIGVALPKGSEWTEKINTAISEMEADGSLQALIDKWFPAN
jgi:arginine/lysine/histidine transporter system substrate-binding protein